VVVRADVRVTEIARSLREADEIGERARLARERDQRQVHPQFHPSHGSRGYSKDV
jgi:hypothetical protein